MVDRQAKVLGDLHVHQLVVDADPGPRDRLAGERQLRDRLRDADRDGESDPLCILIDGGVDADDLAGAVDQRPARVARVDGGIGLDQVVELLCARLRGVPGHDLPAQARDYAGGHRVLELTQRVADGDGQLPLLEVGAGAQGDGRQAAGVNLDDGQVGQRIDAVDLARQLPAVGQDHGDLGRVLDDVAVGQDPALGVVDESGADPLPGA